MPPLQDTIASHCHSCTSRPYRYLAVQQLLIAKHRGDVLRFAVLASLLLLMGCTKTANLYPANDVARATGVIQARYVAYGVGNGELELTMADGEVVKGEYS